MKKFAFLVHPRAEVARDMSRIWGPLGLVPEVAYGWGLRRLPVPPVVLGTVSHKDGGIDDAGDPLGWIVVVPVGARQLLTAPRRWALAKIEEAVDKAERLGAEVVGLGALTASVTGGGKLLRERPGVTITNGNAFTAQLTHEAIERLLPMTGRTNPHIAFVGATGSVGNCVVNLAAEAGLAGEVTLVARHPGRLEKLAAAVRTTSPHTAVHVSTDMAAVRQADLVVLLTSAAEAVLRAEHLGPGAIVLDDTQPRNTDPSLAEQRPDVLIVDGGMARVDGLDIRANIGDIPDGYAYACLCETMLLALDGHQGQGGIGHPTVEQAHHMQSLAERYRHLGFSLGDFVSFGRPISVPTLPVLELAS